MEPSHVKSTPATPVSGATVGVIGGSIAGCAAAIALERLGCIVTILERSSTGLQDRGSGIGVPPPLRDEMVANGYLPTDYPTWAGGGRRWYVADGSPGRRTTRPCTRASCRPACARPGLSAAKKSIGKATP